MGLLDQVISQVTQAAGPASGTTSHADMITQLVNGLGLNSGSGLTSLIQLFQQKGLGDMISKWVSTGPNPPIAPDQVTHVLGSDKLQQIATQLGVSPTDAASHVAKVLPSLVDTLTPNGNVPQGDLLSTGLGMLKNMLGG
ncbi:MAG: YidB family protein [Gemmatimonadaceae bacterium]